MSSQVVVYEKDGEFLVQEPTLDIIDWVDGSVESFISFLEHETKDMHKSWLDLDREYGYGDDCYVHIDLYRIRKATDKEIEVYKAQQQAVAQAKKNAAKAKRAANKAKKDAEKQRALDIVKKEFPELLK